MVAEHEYLLECFQPRGWANENWF